MKATTPLGAMAFAVHSDTYPGHVFGECDCADWVLRFGGGLTPKGPQAWIDGSDAEVVLFSDEGALFCVRLKSTGEASDAVTSARTLGRCCPVHHPRRTPPAR